MTWIGTIFSSVQCWIIYKELGNELSVNNAQIFYSGQPNSNNLSFLLSALLTNRFHIDQILFCPVPYALPKLYLVENKEQGLIFKNSNIYDKSTSILGDYDTNEHIQDFNGDEAL